MSAQERLSRDFARLARHALAGFAFAMAALSVAPAFADAKCGQDYYDGLRAYDAGNKKAAIDIWTRAGLAGDVRAQYRLGQVYENGDKVLINYVEAHKWYNLAANNDLQNCSGDFGSKEARQARDHSREARDRLEHVMTNRAITDAQREVVSLYECKADTRSLYELARIYQKGSGLPQSSIDACRYYAVAAAKNGPSSNEARDALDVLNKVLSPEQIDNCQREASRWMRPGGEVCMASAGGSDCKGARRVPMANLQAALRALGFYRGPLDGSYGGSTRQAVRDFQRDLNAAPSGDLSEMQICSLIERAASNGDGISQATLGEMYYSGIGKSKNYDSARDWFEQAADRGVPSALFRLGSMYVEGVGVQRDTHRGCDDLRQADRQGHPGADREISKYCYGRRGDRDDDN